MNALGCGSAPRAQASVSHQDTSKLAESEGWYTRCVQRPDGFPIVDVSFSTSEGGLQGLDVTLKLFDALIPKLNLLL